MQPHQTPNTPYNLTTEHGRSQSFAHGPWGAFLTKNVEQALQDQHEKFAFAVHNAVTAAVEKLSAETLAEFALRRHFEEFLEDLGKHDKERFAVLLRSYRQERKLFEEQIEIHTKLLAEIEELFKGAI